MLRIDKLIENISEEEAKSFITGLCKEDQIIALRCKIQFFDQLQKKADDIEYLTSLLRRLQKRLPKREEKLFIGELSNLLRLSLDKISERNYRASFQLISAVTMVFYETYGRYQSKETTEIEIGLHHAFSKLVYSPLAPDLADEIWERMVEFLLIDFYVLPSSPPYFYQSLRQLPSRENDILKLLREILQRSSRMNDQVGEYYTETIYRRGRTISPEFITRNIGIESWVKGMVKADVLQDHLDHVFELLVATPSQKTKKEVSHFMVHAAGEYFTKDHWDKLITNTIIPYNDSALYSLLKKYIPSHFDGSIIHLLLKQKKYVLAMKIMEIEEDWSGMIELLHLRNDPFLLDNHQVNLLARHKYSSLRIFLTQWITNYLSEHLGEPSANTVGRLLHLVQESAVLNLSRHLERHIHSTFGSRLSLQR